MTAGQRQATAAVLAAVAAVRQQLAQGDLRRAIELVENMLQLLHSIFRDVGVSFGWAYSDHPIKLLKALRK